MMAGKTSIILNTSKSMGQKVCESVQNIPSICLSSCEFDLGESGYITPPKMSFKTSFTLSTGYSASYNPKNCKCGSINLYNMTKSTNYRNALMKQASMIHKCSSISKSLAFNSRSSISFEEKRNKAAIKIQALVRRFLCLRHFDLEEIKRIERRMVVQADAFDKARESVANLSFTPHIRINYFKVISRDIYKKSHLLASGNVYILLFNFVYFNLFCSLFIFSLFFFSLFYI